MPDYGRLLQFGYFLTPAAAPAGAVLQTAERVEALGLDLIGIQDHPYQRRFLDTWTLLAFIAARTRRVRLFPDVANLPLRPPVMLAKAAASLDLLSGGRLELGLGAGAFWEAIKAMGGPMRSPAEAVDALEEAITVIRLMWSQERSAKFEGSHYSLRGAHPGPSPAHPIGIWLGAYGPRMLNLVGRRADGWVPSLSYLKPGQIKPMQQRIDDAAARAGRDPAGIQRVLNLSGSITAGESSGLLQGPVGQWVDDLTRLTLEDGLDSYLFGGPPGRELEQFAQEVVPQVREQVARERARAQSAAAS
jgi:alkanesulfonate monooxygenase SsuD/methylene tetrahydromethanopterin reductase-like flavin-dependent oxidoreductase (luciferase family)